MTPDINIFVKNASGVTNGQKTPASQASAGQDGQNRVVDFISMLLQKAPVAPVTPLNGLTNSAQLATDATGELAAKISALLQQNGGDLDMAALQALLPPDMAAMLAQTLETQNAALPTPTLLGDTPAATVGAGLNSDLTAQAAGTLQDAGLLNDLAAQLNTLEPGAETLPLTDTTVAVEDEMMATLLALQGKTAAPVVPPLAQQAASRTDALRTSTPADAMPQNAGLTPGALSGEPVAGDARGIPLATDTASLAAKSAPILVNTPAASLTAQVAQAQTQVQPQPQQNTNLFSGMLGSSLGTLNSLLGGGMGGSDGFSSDQGFSGQSGFGAEGSSLENTGLDALAGKTSSNGASFTNYIAAAAGRGNAATTQMIGLQMSRNAASKIDTFTMQLEPADLGRLEVQMRFGKDGAVSAKLIADKPETLTMLQRDSGQLERILQQSGLEVADGALSFDLRQQNQQSLYEGNGHNDRDLYAGRGDRAHKNDATLTAEVAIQAAGYVSQSGVNIMV